MSTADHDLVSVTTWSVRRRHMARLADLSPAGDRVPGLKGPTLCSTETMPAEGYDQVGINGQFARYGSGQRLTDVVIAELPECKRCVQQLERMRREVR